jgi:hypothetical protein
MLTVVLIRPQQRSAVLSKRVVPHSAFRATLPQYLARQLAGKLVCRWLLVAPDERFRQGPGNTETTDQAFVGLAGSTPPAGSRPL